MRDAAGRGSLLGLGCAQRVDEASQLSDGGVCALFDDLECSVVGQASAYAGSDASEVAWVRADELEALPCVDLLVETLRGWGVLDRIG